MTIEARPYGPETAPAERQELRERVWRLEEGLFMILEVPVQTPYTLDLMFDRLEELATGLERFAYVDRSEQREAARRSRARAAEAARRAHQPTAGARGHRDRRRTR